MASIIDTLITDRAQADVDRARYLNRLWNARTGRWTGTDEEWGEWTAGPRGSYGFNDMNRVTQTVAYLTGRLEELGYCVATGNVVPAYSIQVNAEPSNGGVALGGGTFYLGDEIVVVAQPGEKYDFVGWSDAEGIVSGDLVYSFTAERSRTLTAVFVLKQFRVDVAVEPDGSGQASGAGVYSIDTEITVAASAADGYAFTCWTEDGETVADGAEYTFTLDRDRTLRAVMTKTHVIAVSASDNDGGAAAGSGTYLDGQTVTVTAAAEDGYEFAGWTENGAVVSTETVYSFPARADRELMAVFVKTYVITLLVDPAGSGTASGGGVYRDGDQVTITAAPESGNRFVSWEVDGESVGTDRSYTFVASGNQTFTAKFVEIPVYTVALFPNPSGGGTVSGGGLYQEGEQVTVTATPASGYRFAAWVEGEFDPDQSSKLPAGYTELEYIESAGTQQIPAHTTLK